MVDAARLTSIYICIHQCYGHNSLMWVRMLTRINASIYGMYKKSELLFHITPGASTQMSCLIASASADGGPINIKYLRWEPNFGPPKV
jgi:hypothetical protein